MPSLQARHPEAGFSAFELVLVLAVVAILAVVGIRVVNGNNKPAASSSTVSSSTPASTVSTAPTINSTSDLNKAEATLNQNDPGTANTSDSSQLDSQLSAN